VAPSAFDEMRLFIIMIIIIIINFNFFAAYSASVCVLKVRDTTIVMFLEHVGLDWFQFLQNSYS